MKVRLKEFKERKPDITSTCFNSMKVRLKVYSGVNALPVYLFQFHEGTIKGDFNFKWEMRSKWFQFHEGTIKGPEFIISIKVSTVFQFHEGTIKGQFHKDWMEGLMRVSIP